MARLLKTEQPQHVKAFEEYYALGPKRSYAKLAPVLDVDKATIKLWGRSFAWQGRIRAREIAEARETADVTINTHVNDRQRRRKLIDLALFKIAKAIAEDKVKYQASDLERIMRLMEEWDAATNWTDGGPKNDPHEIVEYLRSLLTSNLEEAFTIIKDKLDEEFPGYTERRLPVVSGESFRDSNMATLEVLGIARLERG